MSGLSPLTLEFQNLLWRAVPDADDPEARILEGVATSSRTDLAGDVLEPKGATYELPMPLLMQHDRDRPIGEVEAARVTASEIVVRARVKTDTGLDYVEDAWKQLKSGLVRGFSIGAQPLAAEPILDKDGRFTGVRYTAWRWLELSAVTLAMNPAASLTVRMLGPWGCTATEARSAPLSDAGAAGRQSYEATRARGRAAQAAARVALQRNF